jgi:hypothetical protein
MRRICLPRRKDDVKEQRKIRLAIIFVIFVKRQKDYIKEQRKIIFGKLAIIFVKRQKDVRLCQKTTEYNFRQMVIFVKRRIEFGK